MGYLRALFILLVVLAALVVGAGAAVRMGRNKVSAPSTVKPSLVSVENSGGIYVFAARVGPRVVLFDTGADPAGAPIDVALGALGGSRGDVTDVFLTHGHGDHTAGASQLPRARIHLGDGDVALAAGKATPEALMVRVMALVMPAPPVTTTDPLTGAATIDVGEGKSVKAVPVPGHTPGSYAFLFDGVLFVGDIMVLKQGRLEPTPRLFDPRPEENRAAIRSLKLQLAGDTVDIVCTAHGGCTPKGLGQNLLDEIVTRI
jgi:glyoxylase-like metal-dependent hydrolase (beta-lactamase superfamily II)